MPDNVHNDLSIKISKELENKTTLVICQSGWSSIQNDPTIAHSWWKKTFLHNIVDCGVEKKTPDYWFNEATLEIKTQYVKDVFAICTDNEAKMVKVRELALKEYPAVLTYGCSAHYMSLLEKDIGNTVNLNQILEIQNYFRNLCLAQGLLKEKGGACQSCPMRHVGSCRLLV